MLSRPFARADAPSQLTMYYALASSMDQPPSKRAGRRFGVLHGVLVGLSSVTAAPHVRETSPTVSGEAATLAASAAPAGHMV